MVEADDGALERGETGGETRVGEDRLRAGILEHEGEAVFRAGQVERKISAARLEDAEDARGEIEGAVEVDADERFRADAEFAAARRRDLVRAGVEFAVGEARAIQRKGNRVGMERNLRFNATEGQHGANKAFLGANG